MRRSRGRSAAWTGLVIVCATVALYGVASFMARVHRGWNDIAHSTSPAIGDVTGAEAPESPRPADRPAGPAPPPGAAADAPDSDDARSAGSTPSGVPAALVAALRERRLTIPVEGVGAGALVRSFDEPRGQRIHEALDIMAAAGTPVLAVEDGTVAKLFTSEAGGLAIYQYDWSRSVAYYYAHLQRYAPGLTEGATLRRGQVIGYVGSTGNARPDAPHLHFAIFRLGPEQRWWEGAAIDPYLVLR